MIDDALTAGADEILALFEHCGDAERASLVLATRLPGAALVCIDSRGRFAVRYVAGSATARVADLSPRSLRALLSVPDVAS